MRFRQGNSRDEELIHFPSHSGWGVGGESVPHLGEQFFYLGLFFCAKAEQRTAGAAAEIAIEVASVLDAADAQVAYYAFIDRSDKHLFVFG